MRTITLRTPGPAVLALLTAQLLSGSIWAASSQNDAADKTTALEILGKCRAAYGALSSYSDTGTVVSEMAGTTNVLSFKSLLQRPNQYRVAWTQATTIKGIPACEGAVWSDGTGDYLVSSGPGQDPSGKAKKLDNLSHTLSAAAGPSWSAATSVPGIFFNQGVEDAFMAPVVSGHYPLTREKDTQVGGIDCYVISSSLDLSKAPESRKPGTANITLWIGKKDLLLHQSRTKYFEKTDFNPATNDEAVDTAIRKSLEMEHKPATPEAIAAMRPQMREIMKQVQSNLKTAFDAGVVMTQRHENIAVNEHLATGAFVR